MSYEFYEIPILFTKMFKYITKNGKPNLPSLHSRIPLTSQITPDYWKIQLLQLPTTPSPFFQKSGNENPHFSASLLLLLGIGGEAIFTSLNNIS